MSACRRSARASVPPLRFRFSHFIAQKATSRPIPRAPAAAAPLAAKAAKPIERAPLPPDFSQSDNPLEELKQYLARVGFPVVNDYRSSDDAASFEDK
jgi:hypothetical protein